MNRTRFFSLFLVFGDFFFISFYFGLNKKFGMKYVKSWKKFSILWFRCWVKWNFCERLLWKFAAVESVASRRLREGQVSNIWNRFLVENLKKLRNFQGFRRFLSNLKGFYLICRVLLTFIGFLKTFELFSVNFEGFQEHLNGFHTFP